MNPLETGHQVYIILANNLRSNANNRGLYNKKCFLYRLRRVGF